MLVSLQWKLGACCRTVGRRGGDRSGKGNQLFGRDLRADREGAGVGGQGLYDLVCGVQYSVVFNTIHHPDKDRLVICNAYHDFGWPGGSEKVRRKLKLMSASVVFCKLYCTIQSFVVQEVLFCTQKSYGKYNTEMYSIPFFLPVQIYKNVLDNTQTRLGYCC
jgi:hypothetical protein